MRFSQVSRPEPAPADFNLATEGRTARRPHRASGVKKRHYCCTAVSRFSSSIVLLLLLLLLAVVDSILNLETDSFFD